MLCAVVLIRRRFALDCYHNLGFHRRDLQLAFSLGDCVVVCLECCAFRVGDRVRHFTFSNRRYTAGRLDVRDFTFHEAVAAYRYSGLRQRCAVIRLLAAFTRQRYTALLND